MFLPLRAFNSTLVAGEGPAEHWQDRATARAQLPAVVAAARGGRRVAQHLPSSGRSSRPTIRVVEPDKVLVTFTATPAQTSALPEYDIFHYIEIKRVSDGAITTAVNGKVEVSD